MTTSKKKAAGLSALKNLQSPEASSEVVPAKSKTSKAAAKKKTTPPSPAPTRSKSPVAPSPTAIKSFNLNLPLEAHEKLREIAFHEKDSMTSLILDGINLLFAERGLSPIAKRNT